MSNKIPPASRVAVIGAGPAGYAAVRALVLEKKANVIRVFERRDRVGGIWHLDPLPDEFPLSSKHLRKLQVPSHLPTFADAAPEDITARTAVYEKLDSNVGATLMAFSHAPFPNKNSATSVLRIGPNNPSRPFRVVQKYLETLFQEHFGFLSLRTSVERLEKVGSEWVISLRQPGHVQDGQAKDFWWQEKFDAVVVATGHYNEGFIPEIDGLADTYQQFPDHFEHSKSYRNPDKFVDKKVVVVGGSVSATDLISDLYGIVKGPLYTSQRRVNEALAAAWDLPNVVKKRQIRRIGSNNGKVHVVFDDGVVVRDVDNIIFATGFRVSYPFIFPNPVTSTGHLHGVYEHIVKIGDPTLSFLGQVKGGLTFRVFEYQATAIARILAGAGHLPSISEQEAWYERRLKQKGDGPLFHEILPDFGPYWNRLREIAGQASPGADSSELPEWKQDFADIALAIVPKKTEWWREQADQAKARL